MKSFVLAMALALSQTAAGQGDPFMDLTMPELTAPEEQPQAASPSSATAPEASPIKDASAPGTSAKSVAPSPYGCPPQERPAWEAEIPVRESYKSLLLLNIYEAIWIRNVERDGTCNCENRVPSWDEADMIYQTLFSNLDAADQMSFRQKIGEANRLRLREVDKLCNKEMPQWQ